MANLGNIVYLTEAQKNELFALGSVTSNNRTVTYSANDLYITPDKSIDKIMLNGANYTALNGTVDLGNVLNSDVIAPEEQYTATTQLYNSGDVFVHKGKLYRATTTIATSTNIIPNTNCEEVQIIDLINEKDDLPLIINISKENNVEVCDTAASIICEAVENNKTILCFADRQSSYIAPTSNIFLFKLINFSVSSSTGKVDVVQFGNEFITTINNADYFVKTVCTFHSDNSIQWGDTFTLLPTKTSQLTNDSNFYSKPSTGIPSTDIASGVIPDVQVNGTSVVSNGVANIPEASTSEFGVIKRGTGLYYNSSNHTTQVKIASDDQVKGGTTNDSSIVPLREHLAVFYGLAKAAGDITQSASSNTVGTYTTEAKAAIQSMLGIQSSIYLTESVTGTTPSITAVPNVKYICGEVTTISITPPANGTCDIIFESGSTATTLTVPNTVKWPTWFDATSLETNTIYELMITDATYGSVMTWATT